MCMNKKILNLGVTLYYLEKQLRKKLRLLRKYDPIFNSEVCLISLNLVIKKIFDYKGALWNNGSMSAEFSYILISLKNLFQQILILNLDSNKDQLFIDLLSEFYWQLRMKGLISSFKFELKEKSQLLAENALLKQEKLFFTYSSNAGSVLTFDSERLNDSVLYSVVNVDISLDEKLQQVVFVFIDAKDNDCLQKLYQTFMTNTVLSCRDIRLIFVNDMKKKLDKFFVNQDVVDSQIQSFFYASVDSISSCFLPVLTWDLPGLREELFQCCFKLNLIHECLQRFYNSEKSKHIFGCFLELLAESLLNAGVVKNVFLGTRANKLFLTHKEKLFKKFDTGVLLTYYGFPPGVENPIELLANLNPVESSMLFNPDTFDSSFFCPIVSFYIVENDNLKNIVLVLGPNCFSSLK